MAAVVAARLPSSLFEFDIYGVKCRVEQEMTEQCDEKCRVQALSFRNYRAPYKNFTDGNGCPQRHCSRRRRNLLEIEVAEMNRSEEDRRSTVPGRTRRKIRGRCHNSRDKNRQWYVKSMCESEEQKQVEGTQKGQSTRQRQNRQRCRSGEEFVEIERGIGNAEE